MPTVESARVAAWRGSNPEAAAAQRARYDRRRKERIRAAIRARKDVPCADCGGRFHFSAMHFDHVRGTKLFGIATVRSLGVSMGALAEEMAKCEVVCANCHAVRTYTAQAEEEAS